MIKVLIFVLSLSFSLIAQNIQKLDNWANDFTGTLKKSELVELNSRLKAYQDSTTNQIVVLIISSLEGNSIEELANEIFKFNRIGTKKNDNGVLILISKEDKKIRIEVGYGLESRLTDATSSSIIRNEIIPFFKEEKYYEGIDSGINAIFQAIQGEYSKQNSSKDNNNLSPWAILIILIFIIFFSNIFRRANRTFRIGRHTGIYRTPWGGFGGGFGGFGGGSFGGGGFSGGGGMSGGGGASGQW